MDISIIVIGDELLLGQVTDTNSGALARAVAPIGWHVSRVFTVPDSAEAIADAIDRALAISPIVLTTGGLGPTKDDITKQVLMQRFGGTLRLNKDALDNLTRIFERRGLQLNDLTRSQAMLPSTCVPIPNDLGTAPGMWFETPDGHVLIAMPGVPFETEYMFPEKVLPMLRNHFAPGISVWHRSLLVTGISESALAERLSGFEDSLPSGLHLAYLPDQGYLRLRLDAVGVHEDIFETTFSSLTEMIGAELLAVTELSLPALLLYMLRERGLTIATAESCTGGSVAAALTSIPGSSDCVNGGVVAYSNQVKINLLGVDASLIESLGAVSEPVAAQMALGVARITGSDVAIATSGIAGPGGGTPDKPVGTVCIAVSLRGEVLAVTHRMPGSRQRVVTRSVNTALIMAMKRLKNF